MLWDWNREFFREVNIKFQSPTWHQPNLLSMGIPRFRTFPLKSTMFHNFFRHLSFLIRHVVLSLPKQSNSYTISFQTSLMIITLTIDSRIHHLTSHFLPYFPHMYVSLHTTLPIFYILSSKTKNSSISLFHVNSSQIFKYFWNKKMEKIRRKIKEREK